MRNRLYHKNAVTNLNDPGPYTKDDMPEKEETIKVKAKNLDIELGNLKITTTKEPSEYDQVMTGKDVDVFIDGKNFRDTPLKYIYNIQINIGNAEEVVEVTYKCLPFVKGKKK